MTTNLTLIELCRELAGATDRIRRDRPSSLVLAGATIQVEYQEDDEDGAEYARIRLTIGDDWCAEIDSGTYGALQGFRLYLDPASAEEDKWIEFGRYSFPLDHIASEPENYFGQTHPTIPPSEAVSSFGEEEIEAMLAYAEEDMDHIDDDASVTEINLLCRGALQVLYDRDGDDCWRNSDLFSF
jgi:hypothetical protein